jgi:hypothetical protein
MKKVWHKNGFFKVQERKWIQLSASVRKKASACVEFLPHKEKLRRPHTSSFFARHGTRPRVGIVEILKNPAFVLSSNIMYGHLVWVFFYLPSRSSAT